MRGLTACLDPPSSASLSPSSIQEEKARPAVPDPPPSPKKVWRLQGSKKQQRKQIQRVLKAGKPLDTNLYRTVYGDEVSISSPAELRRQVHYHYTWHHGPLRPVVADSQWRLQVRPELVIKHHVQPIGIQDVQALVLWTIADFREGSNPKWAFIKVSCYLDTV